MDYQIHFKNRDDLIDMIHSLASLYGDRATDLKIKIKKNTMVVQDSLMGQLEDIARREKIEYQI